MNTAKSVDEYLIVLPETSKEKVTELRSLVIKLFPQAEETIKYGLPTFVLQNKNLVHFGAYKKHIGFYPGLAALLKFEEALAAYSTSKGAVQFPLEKPLPINLIKKIIKERALEIKISSKA